MRVSSLVAGRMEVALVAIAWLVLVGTLSIIVLTAPSFTAILVETLDVAQEVGIPSDDVGDLTQAVRAFVASDAADPLPETYDGRAAFDERSVDHLLDVRSVISGTRTAAGVSALLLAAWIVWSGSRKRWVRAAQAVEAGGWTVLAIVIGTGLFGLVGFDRMFTLFHGLLFKEGTWLFPADSLLVRLFPEPFWMVSGVVLVVFMTLGGVVLVVTGRRLRTRGVAAATSTALS